MIRPILIALLLQACLPLPAQSDSTRFDGQLWHELPPVMNLVNAGYLLDRDARASRDALFCTLGGLAVGGVFIATGSEQVGGALVGAGLAGGVVLHLRAVRHRRRAAMLLQLGYGINMRYEMAPDNIAQPPPAPITR